MWTIVHSPSNLLDHADCRERRLGRSFERPRERTYMEEGRLCEVCWGHYLRRTFACILSADLTELTSIVYNFKFHMRSYVSEKVSLRTNLHSVTHLFLK